MGTLIYSMLVSADGYVNRPDRSFEWADPDDETLEFITSRMQAVGGYLYGRRYYETMTSWASLRSVPGLKPLDYAFSDLWTATTKYVFSRTMSEPLTPNTVLVRDFDANAVRTLKETSDKHLTVEGTEIGELCLRAGLVDSISLYQVPIATGGGTPFFPQELPLRLTLDEVHAFRSGIVNLRYTPSYDHAGY